METGWPSSSQSKPMTICMLAFLAIAIIAKGRQCVVRAFQVATGDIIQKQADRCGLGALRKEPILYRGLGPSQPIQVLVQRILIKRA